jgi:hypothetical protein
MTSNNIDSILSKVQKLLALAGNNPSEAEAAAAMERAQELLAKYNLTMAQLDESVKSKGGSVAEAKRTKEKVERSAMFKFQRAIWAALAETNFCVYWSQKVFHSSGIYSTHHHYLIGREENVVTVKVMGEYLEKTINRLCPYKSGKDVHLWKEGCAERICERLRAKRREMERANQPTATSDSTAVVLASVYTNEDHANHLFQYGPGSESWCPCRTCRERRWAEYQARQAAMPREDLPAVVEDRETPAQRRKREEANERRWERQQQQWRREQEREAERTGSEAYQAGRAKGNEIGIDSQIDSKK